MAEAMEKKFPFLFQLNREKFFQILPKIKDFSPSLSEMALIRKMVMFFYPELPCNHQELHSIFIFGLKEFKLRNDTPVFKISGMNIGARYNYLEYLQKHITELLIASFHSEDREKLDSFLKNLGEKFFEAYL